MCLCEEEEVLSVKIVSLLLLLFYVWFVSNFTLFAVCLFVCLFVCSFVCLSVCLFAHLFVHLFVCVVLFVLFC